MPARLSASLALLSAALLAVSSVPAFAVTAQSDWQAGTGARTRLIAATLADASGKERLVAGLEVELEPGWKTYWRTPGDSGGMPPQFDWDQSTNIARATMLYPAPHRFKDAMGTSVGYKEHVVFPIEVSPDARSKPVELRLGAVLGICKDICVPVEAELSLQIPPEGASDPQIEQRLRAFSDAVPGTSELQAGPRLESLVRTEAGGKRELIALVRFPKGATGRDLFVEADDLSYLPVPASDGEEGGLARFRIDLAKADRTAAEPGRMLILTIVSSAGNVEIRRKAD